MKPNVNSIEVHPNWVIMDIQWMVCWWVLVQFGQFVVAITTFILCCTHSFHGQSCISNIHKIFVSNKCKISYFTCVKHTSYHSLIFHFLSLGLTLLFPKNFVFKFNQTPPTYHLAYLWTNTPISLTLFLSYWCMFEGEFAAPNHYPPLGVSIGDKVDTLLFHIKNYPPYLILLQLLK